MNGKKNGLVYSKPCSKVDLLLQTLHLGHKTFVFTCAQTENERHMLKQQIKLLPTLFKWSAIVILTLNFEARMLKKGWI